jgi:hypothetical protein
VENVPKGKGHCSKTGAQLRGGSRRAYASELMSHVDIQITVPNSVKKGHGCPGNNTNEQFVVCTCL